jgi:hypothetical protein
MYDCFYSNVFAFSLQDSYMYHENTSFLTLTPKEGKKSNLCWQGNIYTYMYLAF